MKLLIASDLHGSASACEQLLTAFEREQVDTLVLLGDLLYHGPRNNLPDGYAPKRVIELLNSVKDQLLCVRGNCDGEVDQMVLEFPILAEYAVLWVDGLRLYATHGHHNAPPLPSGSVLLCGHTHIPAWELRDGICSVNPGSVAIPKGGSPASYLTLENRQFQWKTMDGAVWKTVVPPFS
jgi:hypothetical protein